MDLTGAAAAARRAYKRKWAKQNPDKVRAQQDRYWQRVAERAAANADPAEPEQETAAQA